MSDLLKLLRHQASIFRRGGANGRADLIGNAADLIEQQQQRITELEAHVDRLLEFDLTPEEYHKLTVSQRYTQSLAEHDAEIARKAYEKGYLTSSENYHGGNTEYMKVIEFANEYAERVKQVNTRNG